MAQITTDQGRGAPGGATYDVLPQRPPAGPPPGPPPARSAASSRNLLYAAAVVVGLVLGAFGVIRLTAEDSELARLDDELTAVEADQGDVRDQLTQTKAEETAVVEAAVALEAALVDLSAKFDAFVDGQNDVVQTWNLLLDSSATVAEEGAGFDAQVRPAITAAQATVTVLLEALTQTQDAYSALQDALATGGG